jgi:hypothetical protein
MYWEKEDTRIIKRFAFIPIHIDHKYYWLETVYIYQTKPHYKCGRWFDMCFKSKQEYQDWKKERKERLKKNAII